MVSTSAQNRPTMAATVELTNQIQRRRESHDLEVLTQDTLLHLQSSEVTLASYLSHVVRLSSGLLAHLLSKAGVGATSEGEIMSEATSGISASLQLLSSTVELFEARETLMYVSSLSPQTMALPSLKESHTHRKRRTIIKKNVIKRGALLPIPILAAGIWKVWSWGGRGGGHTSNREPLFGTLTLPGSLETHL